MGWLCGKQGFIKVACLLKVLCINMALSREVRNIKQRSLTQLQKADPSHQAIRFSGKSYGSTPRRTESAPFGGTAANPYPL